MAAPKKSKSQKAAGTATTIVYSLPYQAEALTLLFFILSFIGILYHEPWRDELQAYLLGRESHSISELLNNIKYEGHPPLWHFIMFIQSHLIDSLFVAQVVHTLIACTTVYIFNKYFTLDYRLKILASFSYFLFYEYNLVVRSYGLGVMLLFAAIALYTQKVSPLKTQQAKTIYYLLLGLILILLCNTSVMGLVMSASFMSLLLTDYMMAYREKMLNRQMLVNGGLLTVCFVIAVSSGYYFIKSEPDNSYPVTYNEGFQFGAVKFAISKMFTNYYPLLPTDSHLYWNQHLLINDELGKGFYLGALTLLLFGAYILKHSRVALFYFSGTIATLLFIYLTNMRPYRYSGHLFIYLLIAFALVEYYKSAKQVYSIQLPSLVNRVAGFAFTASLLINLSASAIAYYKDLKYPFSNFTKAGEYIMKNHLDRYPLIGSSDFIVSPLTYYTHKPVRLVESKRDQRFMIWDSARRNRIDFNDIISDLNAYVNLHDSVILILSTPLTYIGPDKQTYAFSEDNIGGTDIHLKFIHKIDDVNVVNDEVYYLYMANKIKP